MTRKPEPADSPTAPRHGIPEIVYSNWEVATEHARNGESEPDSDGTTGSATELIRVKRGADHKSSRRGRKAISPGPNSDSDSGSVDSTTSRNDNTNGGKISVQRPEIVGTLSYFTLLDLLA